MATEYSGEFAGTFTDGGSGGVWKGVITPDPNQLYTDFYDDFFRDDTSTTALAAKWYNVSTDTDANTAASVILADASDAVGGKLRITTNPDVTDSGDYITLTGNQPVFYVSDAGTDADVRFETRFKVSDASEVALFFGLTSANSNLCVAPESGMGFVCRAGSVEFTEVSNNVSATTATAYTISDNEYIRLGFIWDSTASTVTYFVNGSEIADIALTASNSSYGPLKPGIENATSVDTEESTLVMDWIRVTQPRVTNGT